MARMSHDLANSVETKLQITPFYLMLSIFKNACAYEAVALILRNWWKKHYVIKTYDAIEW